MKRNNKRVVALIIVIVVMNIICISLVLFALFGGYRLKGMRYLNSNPDHTNDYFNETNIGNYKEIYFQLYHRNMIIFESDSSTLVATYGADEYAKQADKLKDEVVFLETEEEGVYGDFQIGEWYFEVCKFENSRYPKDFALIGFQEEECKIAYLEFYDIDLDYVSGERENGESMKDFVKEYFKFNFE